MKPGALGIIHFIGHVGVYDTEFYIRRHIFPGGWIPSLADVASSDQHTVKPWLSGKLDFSPPVTDLTGAGFPLVGGRVDYVDHRPVAALVYRHREHVINVFVWPDRSAAGRTAPTHSASKRGYNVVHWTDAGLAFWAISDLNAPEMKTFAETYAGAS